MSRSGNSTIPTDKQYDDYYAIRCEECHVKLTSEELKQGEPYLCATCAEEQHEH